MACATVRTFSYVKSSAMTPRHPSVPNLIGVTAQSISDAFSAGKEVLSGKPEITSQNGRTPIVVQRFTTSACVSALPATSRFSPHPAISPAGKEESRHPSPLTPNHALRLPLQISSGSKNNFRWRLPQTSGPPKHLLQASTPAVRAPRPTTLYRSSQPSQELRKHEWMTRSRSCASWLYRILIAWPAPLPRNLRKYFPAVDKFSLMPTHTDAFQWFSPAPSTPNVSPEESAPEHSKKSMRATQTSPRSKDVSQTRRTCAPHLATVSP